jgi:hypothetical protein
MENLKKHLCVRLTGDQFRLLADQLVDEQISKSVLVRNLIQDYLESHNNKIEALNKDENEEYQH